MTSMSDWAWQIYQKIPIQPKQRGFHLSEFMGNLARRFPVLLLRAPAKPDGRALSVITAGPQPWCEAVPLALLRCMPERTQLGSVTLWNLPRTLERLAPSADLVIAVVDQLSARLLFGSDYLVCPNGVCLWVDIPKDLPSFYAGRHRRNLKNDLRRMARNGLACEISCGDTGLETFYHQFYVPFVQQRWGGFSRVTDLRTLRFLVRQGGLVWVLQDGKRVAGCAFEQQGTLVNLLVLGTAHGDYGPVDAGAFVAIYDALIQHSHRLGCEQINLGASQPLLNDGTVRFKRKWGGRLVDIWYRPRLLLRWGRLDQCVLDMLAGTGLVFVEQGHLSAVSTLASAAPATADQVAEAYRYLWTRGLHTLCLCSASGFEPGVEPLPHSRLIDLTTADGADLPRLLAYPDTARS